VKDTVVSVASMDFLQCIWRKAISKKQILLSLLSCNRGY